MKKLAIMFVMLLGSVATMQAQTFDFSCDDQITNSGGQTDSFSDVQEGFSDDQELGFSLSGFGVVELNNGSDVYRKTVEREGTTLVGNLSVNYGTFYNGRNEEQYGPGPFPYRIIGLAGPGTVDFYETAEEVAEALMLLDPNADAGHGFTNAEEGLLASYVANDGSGMLFEGTAEGGYTQIATGNYDGGYIIVAIEGNGFRVYDEDENVYEFHTTFRSALDAALAYANA